jgi:hypothetical protein
MSHSKYGYLLSASLKLYLKFLFFLSLNFQKTEESHQTIHTQFNLHQNSLLF